MLDDAAAPAGQQDQEPPPPPIETPVDLWDPAGDPEALERAAAAWEQIATHLADLRHALDAQIGALAGRWTGQARQAFDHTWAGHAAALADGEQGAREMAAHLREIAGQVRAVNDEIRALYLELAATAGVSVLVGLVSFGVGAAAGAARAGLLIRRAVRIKRLLSAFLAARRAVFAATRGSRILRFATRFLRLGGQAVAAEMAVSAVQGQDPFDPEHAGGYGLAAVLGGLPGGRALRGVDDVISRHADDVAVRALRDWSSRRFQLGSETFLLDKRGMKHILQRHHPDYWNGTVKDEQTFLDRRMSIRDVEDAIEQVVQQNRDTLIQNGSNGIYQIRGTVNGVEYVLGIRRGRVAQFYPEGIN